MNEPVFGSPPHRLHRTEDPSTSIEAAYGVKTNKLEAQVWAVIDAAGREGLIADQVRDRMNAIHDVTGYSSVTGRFKPLEEKNLIFYAGDTRPGKSGRQQRVMRSCRFRWGAEG